MAAPASFLLFAALLGVTRADASLPKVADVADLSRPTLQLPAAVLAEPSRFGFAEALTLLNVEKEAPRFSLIDGVEMRRFERTYARNNPLKYVDPDGRSANLANFVSQQTLDRNRTIRSYIRTAGAIAGDVSGISGLGGVADRLAAGLFPQTYREVGANLQGSLAGMMAGFTVPGAGAGVAELASRFAGVEGRADVLGKVITSEGGLKLSQTVENQLLGEGAKNRSFIPAQSILETIGSGSRVADPQGVAGQYLYTAGATYNGSKGTLEVLVNEESGQINHVLFKTTKDLLP